MQVGVCVCMYKCHVWVCCAMFSCCLCVYHACVGMYLRMLVLYLCMLCQVFMHVCVYVMYGFVFYVCSGVFMYLMLNVMEFMKCACVALCYVSFGMQLLYVAYVRYDLHACV